MAGGIIERVKGDITTISADAIVNAARNSLLGGGGVDGAIHKAAGPALLEECRGLGGCETGQAKLTGGYLLNAKHIIHTVGPVWHGGYKDEPALLASCYRSCLKVACESGFSVVAFPGISTGAFGFPKELAATIAINETKRFLGTNILPDKVIFVLFSDHDFEIYRKELTR